MAAQPAAPARAARPLRSMLFIPAHKREWMLKAAAYGADALIYDLEDAAPIDEKPRAREIVAEILGEQRAHPFAQWVRVNGWRTGQMAADLDAVVRPGLDGVLLAKTDSETDVSALDLMLDDLERARGLPAGEIEISPICETAHGIYRTFEVCMASPRVKRIGSLLAVNVPGGDGTRALDLRLSSDARETLYIGARTILEARAAGVQNILGGMTGNIRDLDGLRELHETSRRFGASGAFAIHPSHVPILNEIYTPSSEELERAIAVLRAMANGIARHDAAVLLDGVMIDYAHVRSALDVVERARLAGVDVGEIPDLDVLSRNPGAG
jgi:citrate lyase subunit beta/citryl-CoA lyase